MMNRLPFVLASLFAAACAESPVAGDPTTDPVADVGDGIVDPGPRPAPVTEEPRTCVSIDRGVVRHGTAGLDDLKDVLVSPTGSILVAGSEGGQPQFPGGPEIWSRGIVLEYAHDLATVKERAVINTTGTDSVESIVADPDTGRLWVTARTNAALVDTQASGHFDLVVGELPAGGGLRPAYRGFTSAAENARRIAMAPGGHLAVAGSEIHVGSDDPLVGVFKVSGDAVTPQWYSTRRAASNERYDALAISPTAVIIGGAIADTDEQGMFVAARDLDAGYLWRTQLSPSGRDTVTAVHVLPDGDVLWAGSASSQLGAEYHGGLDIVVGRLDGETGDTEWIQQLGGATDERVTDLAVDHRGRIVLTGAVEASPGDLDAFVLALDAEGNPLLHEQWGSDGADRPAAVTVDACGAIVVAGSTDGDLGGAPRGGRDGFVLVTRLAE